MLSVLKCVEVLTAHSVALGAEELLVLAEATAVQGRRQTCQPTLQQPQTFAR